MDVITLTPFKQAIIDCLADSQSSGSFLVKGYNRPQTQTPSRFFVLYRTDAR